MDDLGSKLTTNRLSQYNFIKLYFEYFEEGSSISFQLSLIFELRGYIFIRNKKIHNPRVIKIKVSDKKNK